MNTPELITDRLILRKFTEKDIEALYQILIEIRKPYKGEKTKTTIKVNNNTFDINRKNTCQTSVPVIY
ncbi:MAG: hypothetical protein U0M37_00585 [Blautia sp.]